MKQFQSFLLFLLVLLVPITASAVIGSGTIGGTGGFFQLNGSALTPTEPTYILGVGTTTPGTILSIQGVGNFAVGTSTLYSGLKFPGGEATSTGFKISGGSLQITSGATSTATNGFNISAGCFAVNGTCVGGAGGITSLGGLTGATQTFSTALGRNTSIFITSAGTTHQFAISDSVNPTFSTLTATSTTASTTISFGVDALRFAAGSTATTSIVGNNGTSTFAGGIESLTAGGITSNNGFTLKGGSFLQSNAASSTFVGGLTTGGLSTGNGLVITGGGILQTINATSTLTGGLTVGGLSVSNGVVITSGNILQTSTATSTFSGGIGMAGMSSSAGVVITGGGILQTNSATSTLTGGLVTGGLSSSAGLVISGGKLTVSSLATSTSNNGFELTSGCFSINGVCVGGGGGGVTGSGAANQVTYWSSGTAVTGSTQLLFDPTNLRFGVGSTTLGTTLAITGDGVVTGKLTTQNLVATGTLVSFPNVSGASASSSVAMTDANSNLIFIRQQMEILAIYTATTATRSIDVSFPARRILEFQLVASTTADEQIRLTFNGDAGANYGWNGADDGAASTKLNAQSFCNWESTASTRSRIYRGTIYNLLGGAKGLIADGIQQAVTANNAPVLRNIGCEWNSAAQATRMRFFSDSGNETIIGGSRLIIWGSND